MSGTHGLIPHQAGYHYITLEEDYVLMFQRSADAWYERTDKSDEKQKEYAARRAHAVAKAYISSVLEQLSDKQFKSGKPEKEIWVFLSFPEIENRIHGGVKMRTLKDAMKEMIEDKYVEKLPNPDRHFKNLIYHMNFKQYRLELQLLPQRLGDSANLHDGPNESANTHDDSANLHDDGADLHGSECKSAPKNNIRDNKEETKNNESTLPSVATSPTASSHDEDAHALSSPSCSLCSEQEDSQMMVETPSTNTAEVSALGPANGKAEPLIASATPTAEPAPPKAAKKPRTPKPVVEAVVTGPAPKPPLPDASMPWGTRKCLLKFDAWRGAKLIVKHKIIQASQCAKGLAETYTEEQVERVYKAMSEDPFYIELGRVDICDVATHIVKYLNRLDRKVTPITSKQQQQGQAQGDRIGADGFRFLTQMETMKLPIDERRAYARRVNEHLQAHPEDRRFFKPGA